ncbi:MAG: AbrB/MazE/SpoVT family DNA-binding domain-containing protein [Candidatus Hadarchaeota archaeon]|nr:AbrB/MazE/SpoVT family DNA-binding domain-containing protein [Candidatus Hadarchaeota archaeon]
MTLTASLTFERFVELDCSKIKLEDGGRMVKVKVSPKGQVVIPQDLRDQFGIKPGQKVSVEGTEEGILILGDRGPVEAMRGMFKKKFKQPSTDLVRGIREEWDRRHAKNESRD